MQQMVTCPVGVTPPVACAPPDIAPAAKAHDPEVVMVAWIETEVRFSGLPEAGLHPLGRLVNVVPPD